MSSSEAASLSFWSSAYGVVVWLVALGVVMEGCEIAARRLAQRKQKRFIGPLQQPIPELQTPHWAHNIGDIGFLILVAALILEPICHSQIEAITGRENRRLTAQLDATTKQAGIAETGAGQANERASTNELAAKQLEIKLNETKTQLANAEARLLEFRKEILPMDIGDQYSLAMALKPMAGTQVELRSAVDANSQETTDWLNSTFVTAGWPIINRAFIPDIGQQGIVIGYNFHADPFVNDSIDDSSKKAAHLLLKLLTERNVPAGIIEDISGYRVRGVPTNAIIVAVMKRPSQLQADLIKTQAKRIIIADQEHKAMERIMELMTNRYVIDSKEMAAAQAEYNEANSQHAQMLKDQSDLFEQEKKLYEQIGKEESGTNSETAGIHMYNTRGGLPSMSAGTNAIVIFHGTSFNGTPLQ